MLRSRPGIEVKSKPMKIIMLLIAFGIGLALFFTNDGLYREFLLVKDKANRLLQQDCLNCIVEAKIKYSGAQKPVGFLRGKHEREHQYNYSYQVDGKYYYGQVLVDSRLLKYFASSNFSYKGEFTERVIIDKNNSADSFPLQYAQMLAKGYQPSALTYKRYFGLFFVIGVLIALFYQVITPSKGKNI
ncbi:hypothetical protein [Entomomonas asaccharolytica]|uniref:Uncharacterized protein n=1 Tax=Entomomonas asaccharolytica TaxID=2785331 RepID=A0A974NE41_9GAMM|nr:hypothetical protein [Entomomonas asaccharolytica]QQP84914.1 hypothetical protein JHT90_10970 [Entomomonas asaccharolytica]